jgi:hypothetical protein
VKLDQDPHQNGKLNPDPLQSEEQDPDSHESEKVEALNGHCRGIGESKCGEK